MVRVEVIIASQKRLIDKSLTYSHTKSLQIGQVVRVTVGQQLLKAIVVEGPKTKQSSKYRLKPIKEVLDGVIIPAKLIDLVRATSSYYGASLSQTAASLLPSGLKTDSQSITAKITDSETEELMPISDEQTKALKIIETSAMNKTVILHGTTGSGKTRVYIELARKSLDNGCGSIILVPEIGLTTQLVQQFSRVFDNIFVIHSKQTPAERQTVWSTILRHPSPIVIGPRSALFSPINNLGLIIVDESHEPAYKQSMAPKYQTQRVARMLATLHGARLVLGSATPSVDDYYLARKRHSPVVTMSKQATGKEHQLAVTVVDITNAENRGQLITSPLKKAISDSLASGLQTLVFHNRRGTSTSAICDNCGFISKCPNCHLPLAHHQDTSLLICHVCNWRTPVSVACPSCHKASLKYHGFGTKQIEMELKKLFPTANIARFDSDVPAKQSLAKRYNELVSGKIDIIVGTQMVAKGLDLPKLETVGIVLADSLLFLPDYSSSERFFQLIYQVIGRVGRHRTGKVIVQTLNPTNPVLLAAIDRDYPHFAKFELEERRLSHYPPYCYLLSLTCTRAKPETARRVSEQLALRLKSTYQGLQILGPSPAFHERTSGKYKWQIVIKSSSRNQLIEIIKTLPAGWSYDIDPNQLLL